MPTCVTIACATGYNNCRCRRRPVGPVFDESVFSVSETKRSRGLQPARSSEAGGGLSRDRRAARAEARGSLRNPHALNAYFKRSGLSAPVAAVLAWALAGLPCGCRTATPTPIEVPTWQLAGAEPVKPTILARARASFDRPLPDHLVQELAPEFSLITITRPNDWADVCRQLHVQPAQNVVDFARGMVVGILANVGQRAESGWPIHLTQVRTVSGVGWLDVVFAPGLYHPLKTAAYVELAYVPDLRAVSRVRIGQRTFVIRPPYPAR